MDIYRIQDVSFAFPKQDRPALSSVTISVREGEFVVVCGKSGSGKSTLLRHLKPALAPHGALEGTIAYKGKPLSEADARAQAAEIGFVLQNPDNGIVTDKVWHELAFGLESLGFDQRTIRLRVAEMASFLGIQTWFHKNVSELSGGQKQLLNLASVMAMHPSVLILDEPTSQLDPIAATEFLETVSKINRELGTTVIMTEHRLEEALPLADRVIVMDEGKVILDDVPAKAGARLRMLGHPMFASMPSPMRVFAGVHEWKDGPLTVKEGREWLGRYLSNRRRADGPGQSSDAATAYRGRSIAISFKDVWFRYERNGGDVIKDLSFEVAEGHIYCLVGGNGTGKTTTLSLVGGLALPYRGKVRVRGDNPAKAGRRGFGGNGLGVLPQNPTTLFVKQTVELDLYEMLEGRGLSRDEQKRRVDEMVAFAELEPMLGQHPYDLSGGEQQRAALAKVLLLEPSVLLLDEPTKGLDGFFKEKLGTFLRKLQGSGVTVLMVSHDIEFCARYGDECGMFFDGTVIASKPAREFFAGNSFYTTAANRMARHIWSDAVTVEDVIALCRRNVNPPQPD
jgi:energy-coupling factor transport system ATP-binding protein